MKVPIMPLNFKLSLLQLHVATFDSKCLELSPNFFLFYVLKKIVVIGSCEIARYDMQCKTSYVLMKFWAMYLVVATAVVGRPCDMVGKSCEVDGG